MMKFIAIAVLAVVAFWYFSCGHDVIGDLGWSESRLAARYSTIPFDAALWRGKDKLARGHMLAGLAERHRFEGLHRDSIVALLGPSECYVGQGDVPCYMVDLGNHSYELLFTVDHSINSASYGHVSRVGLVRLRDRPRPR